MTVDSREIDISFVMPVKNESLRAVSIVSFFNSLSDSNLRFELIVIDDNSDDESHQHFKLAINEARFKGVVEKVLEIGGPGIARNLGIEISNGKYILFVDADDMFHVPRLTELSKRISEMDQDVVYFDFTIEDTREKNYKGSLSRRDEEAFRDQNSLIRNWCNWSVYQECMFAAYRREFLIESAIRFSSGYYEDILFGLKCAHQLKSFEYIPLKVYRKIQQTDSITSSMSLRHIEDYVKVLCEIRQYHHDFLSDENSSKSQFKVNWLTSIFCRLKSIIMFAGSREESIQLFRSYIFLLSQSKLLDSIELESSKREETAYESIFKEFKKLDIGNVQSIRGFFEWSMKRIEYRWSCQDLNGSIFYAPNEVRTCCKRFFVGGKIQGDVVLEIESFNVSNENESKSKDFIDSESIRKAKRNLQRKIDIGQKNPCQHCPFLSLRKWNDFELEMEVDYVSMEQHSICNLRCTYCDEKYYGGLLANYDVFKSLNSLVEKGQLENLQTVVWGGGEPILDPKFDDLLNKIKATAPKCEHRFLSNSVRYSESIAKTLTSSSSMLVTSIDAGDEETYLKIRGRRGFDKSLTSLKKYMDSAPNSIVIKYIFTEGNKSLHQIDNFVESILSYDLQEAFFQISFDFKEEKVTEADLIFPLALYEALYQNGAKFIYFDDLLILRLRSKFPRESVIKQLALLGKSDRFLAKPENYTSIVLFGAGDQASALNNNFKLIEKWPIKAVTETDVDSGENRKFGGKSIQDLREFISSEEPILIAAVQSVPKMYNLAREMGIEKERIIRELLI